MKLWEERGMIHNLASAESPKVSVIDLGWLEKIQEQWRGWVRKSDGCWKKTWDYFFLCKNGIE